MNYPIVTATPRPSRASYGCEPVAIDDASGAYRLLNAKPLSPLMKPIAAFFRANGVSAYLVGGAVRDTLMGRRADDIDIVAQSEAAAIGGELANALGGRCLRLHDDWEVARVILPPECDAAHIDLTTPAGGIEQDLRCRDFSINAMALPIEAVARADYRRFVLDPCGGMRDLRRGVVRMTSPNALREDALRLLRGARFAAQFGFAIDDNTAAVIRQGAPLVTTAAPERTRDEFMKLMRTHNALYGVRLLDDLGLLCDILPELADAKDVSQPKEHYWDVFNHLVESVGWVDRLFCANADNADCLDETLRLAPRFEGIDEYFGGEVGDGFDRLAYLKLAALLHDVAKPATKTIEPSGRIRFIGHHIDGADMARDILTRLRFSKRGVEHVAGMIRQHLRPTQMAQKGEMPTMRALYRYYRDAGDVAVDTLYLNISDYLAARGPLLEARDWANHCALIRYILEAGKRQKAPESLPRLVNGYDIMKEFSLAPGPAIGRLLDIAYEAQAGGDVTTKAQALDIVKSSLERGGDGA